MILYLLDNKTYFEEVFMQNCKITSFDSNGFKLSSLNSNLSEKREALNKIKTEAETISPEKPVPVACSQHSYWITLPEPPIEIHC